MFIQEISIQINTKLSRRKLVDQFECLLGSYHITGQVVNVGSLIYSREFPFIVNNCIKCYVNTLEKNSLHKKYNPLRVKEDVENIEKLCNAKMEVKVLGKTFYYKEACTCKKHTFFILFDSITGPLECGVCFNPIALYRLKELSLVEDFQRMLLWQKNYAACDALQLNCHVGERWATNQMRNHTSELSEMGLDICRNIEKLTGYAVYYYLYNYRRLTLEQDKKRKCPSCGGKWLLKNRFGVIFDFKCDKCKLVSSLTTNLI